MLYLGGHRGGFSEVVLGFRNFGYNEIFEGDFADTCGGKFSYQVIIMIVFH